MKRTSFILMAFALVMTLTQCKKNEEQPTANDNVVTITLNVNKSSGSKVVVDPAMGTVDFETGDKLYVGSGGKYVGFLTHNGTNFSGNITNPTENQPLQLYFLGNVTPQETLSAGTTEECSVIISDQTEHLPVISCAASNENYVSGVTAYSAHLLNKCALVKFNVTTPSNSPICITGMHNKVTVDFANNTMTPSQDGEGVIMLPAGGGENVEKWAILLPQEALEEGEEGSVYSEDGLFVGIRPAIVEIDENEYWADGLCVSVSIRTLPEGAINGLFTINANGDKVYFSKGNLQYIGSVAIPFWKFADNQWEYLGTTFGQNSSDENIDRDLFGWGTSGNNHGAVCYQPWSTSNQNSDYYAYGFNTYSLFDQTGQADWGYNAIFNGGNIENLWRTLNKDEWAYLFNSRNTTSGIRFVKAKVNGRNGIIVLPDDWDILNYVLNNANLLSGCSYEDNTISASNWDNKFENNGAVFLPCGGWRSGINVNSVGVVGDYWTSTSEGSNVYELEFTNNLIPHTQSRHYGFSVRLVQDY